MRCQPRRLACALPFLLLLTGCAGDPDLPHMSGEPAVVPARATHAVHFTATSAVIDSGELLSLNRFLAGAGLSRGDRVRVEQVAAQDEVGQVRRAAIVDELRLAGLRAEPMAGGGARRDALEVAVERSSAAVQGCPDWHDPSIWEAPVEQAKNGLRPNFGCATAANLAAEIARPQDLIAGERPDAVRAPAFVSSAAQNAPVRTVAAPSTGGSGSGSGNGASASGSGGQ